MNLPNDWQSWYEETGLLPACPYEEKRNMTIFTGHGFHWRIDCHGNLCVGESAKTFDRWANSEIDSEPLPRKKKDFSRVVKKLILVAQNYDPKSRYEDPPKREKQKYFRR